MAENQAINPSPITAKSGALLLGWYGGPNGTGKHGWGLYQGQAVGTYNLNGGLLTGGPGGNEMNVTGGLEIVGVSGTGIFNQAGGTNLPTLELNVGGQTGNLIYSFLFPAGPAYGAYNLSGGLLSTGLENVGPAGTGIFTQTGGTNVAGTIYLGGAVNNGFVRTPGTYNFAGGLLQASYISFYSDTYGNVAPHFFNFTGGTLQPSPGATTYYYAPITVGTNASNIATFDANGQNMPLNSGNVALAGPGQLRVIDSVGGGAVVLGNSNDTTLGNGYTGGTTVSSGTLQVLYAQALPNLGVLTVGGPVSLVSSAQAGTLFGSNAAEQAVALEITGVDIASGSPAAGVSGSSIPALATGVGMAPLASGPAPVPEPSTLALLALAR